MWNVPIDVYLSQNQQPGGALVIADTATCPATTKIQTCIQQYLANWSSQGATTVRFFIGMAVPMDDPGPFVVPPICNAQNQTPCWAASVSAAHHTTTRGRARSTATFRARRRPRT